jgi:uncharacterized protein
VKVNALGALFGIGFGFVLSWARLTDPLVIRNMLLFRELDVFFFMGCAVVVAAIGVRLLRAAKVPALATGEAIEWKLERPERRHIVGSVIFGAGWSMAGTCPGPVAAMVGEGRLGGLFVATGLVGGVVLQRAFARSRAHRLASTEVPGVPGL